MARRRNVPAVPEPERLLWERRKGEPAVAFRYFALYRDLGPHRSLAKVALDVKVSLDRLKELSARHGWVDRAEAYDDHIDAQLREARETERVRLERTHFGAGAALLGVALRRLNGVAAAVGPGGEPIEPVTRLDPNSLDAGDVARLMEVGVRVQRISSGLPTDLIKGSTAVAASEVLHMANDLIEIAARFIPEERQARFYAELQSYIDSGRRV